MPQKTSVKMKFPKSPEEVMDVLTKPEFHQARASLQGALSCEVRESSRSESQLVFEVHVTEYAKGPTGINRNKTEPAMTRYTWDLKQRRCDWAWRGAHGDRAKSWGHIHLVPDGKGTRLEQEFNIDVKVPLLGKKIEKKVISEAEKFFPRYENLLKKHLEA